MNISPDYEDLIPTDFAGTLLRREGQSKAEYTYAYTSGKILSGRIPRDASILASLGKRKDMPFPVWTDVWVSPDDSKYSGWGRHRGHLVRKYTATYEAEQNRTKHCDIAAFVEELPRIIDHCRSVVADMHKRAYVTKDELLSVLMLLIFTCAFRIGSKKPSRSKESPRGIFYITSDHIKIKDHKVEIAFTGKWGKHNACEINDKNVYLLLHRLLQDARPHGFVFAGRDNPSVTYADVLKFLKSFAPNRKALDYFTPKSLRIVLVHTRLIASILPWISLPSQSAASRKKQLHAAIRKNAELAYHTASVQKKSYLNPTILQWIQEGDPETMSLFRTNKSPEEIYKKLIARACKISTY